MNAVIRKATQADHNLILSTWLRSYKYGSNWGQSMAAEEYYPWHELIIKGILERPGTYVYCAVDPEATDVVWGYSVYEQQGPNQVLHYVYVKKAFRGFGICKLLTQQPFTHYTHKTFDPIISKLTAIYSPYRI